MQYRNTACYALRTLDQSTLLKKNGISRTHIRMKLSGIDSTQRLNVLSTA
jgi:hypothetical protein